MIELVDKKQALMEHTKFVYEHVLFPCVDTSLRYRIQGLSRDRLRAELDEILTLIVNEVEESVKGYTDETI